MTIDSIYSERITALRAEEYSPRCLSILEEYLAARRQVKKVNVAVLSVFADGRKRALADLARGLAKAIPDDPDLPIIHAAIHLFSREQPKSIGKGRAPVYSVLLSEVPNEIILQVEEIRLKPKAKKEMLFVLRQVLGAARRSSLPEVICERSITEYLAELAGRDIKAITKKERIRIIKKFATHQSFSLDFIDRLKVDESAARLQGRAEPSVRMQSYLNNPLTTVEVLKIASQVSAEAESAVQNGEGRQSIHRLYITAGLLALLSYIPERRGDLVKLIIGQSIRRDAFAWSLWTRSGKTGTDRCTDKLPSILTPYLDDLILLGSSPGVRNATLTSLLDQRITMKSPLFARINLKKSYSGNRVFELIKEKTGHGPHAFRKSATDELVLLGASQGEIMAHLGHRNAETAPQHYEGLANEIRREAAGVKLRDARDRDPSKLITPAGRSFDLEAINTSLRWAT